MMNKNKITIRRKNTGSQACSLISWDSLERLLKSSGKLKKTKKLIDLN